MPNIWRSLLPKNMPVQALRLENSKSGYIDPLQTNNLEKGVPWLYRDFERRHGYPCAARIMLQNSSLLLAQCEG